MTQQEEAAVRALLDELRWRLDSLGCSNGEDLSPEERAAYYYVEKLLDADGLRPVEPPQ